MFLLRAAPNFVRRTRFSPETASRCRSAFNSASRTQISGLIKGSHPCRSGDYTWRTNNEVFPLWIMVAAQAAIFLGISSDPALAEEPAIESDSQSDAEAVDMGGLQRIDDGSVISNIHTTKWRVFTDNARDSFLKGKLEDAERFFVLALQEAKEGFGERDPHVASACNNLAELYRVIKAYDKAEPLYLEAVNILEEAFGPQDIRVGVAFHNLGQFHLVQRQLEKARVYYEKALKIKGRVLGYGHPEYADTMYHLGTVLHLQGKEKESEALILDSIRILEEAGQGESNLCIKRSLNLAKIYQKSGHLEGAENMQRKILHKLELSKGWNSLETVMVAEGLALTLQAAGNLREAQELLERCLDARRTLLSENHIQIGANMLHMAQLEMLIANQLRKRSAGEAIIELDKAKHLLDNSIRIARDVLNKSVKQRGKGDVADSRKDGRIAMNILLQSLDALGLLEITKQELEETKDKNLHLVEAKDALVQCISSYKEFAHERSICGYPEVKAEYVSCLKLLTNLITDITQEREWHSQRVNVQELKDEIGQVEKEISLLRRRKE